MCESVHGGRSPSACDRDGSDANRGGVDPERLPRGARFSKHTIETGIPTVRFTAGTRRRERNYETDRVGFEPTVRF